MWHFLVTPRHWHMPMQGWTTHKMTKLELFIFCHSPFNNDVVCVFVQMWNLMQTCVFVHKNNPKTQNTDLQPIPKLKNTITYTNTNTVLIPMNSQHHHHETMMHMTLAWPCDMLNALTWCQSDWHFNWNDGSMHDSVQWLLRFDEKTTCCVFVCLCIWDWRTINNTFVVSKHVAIFAKRSSWIMESNSQVHCLFDTGSWSNKLWSKCCHLNISLFLEMPINWCLVHKVPHTRIWSTIFHTMMWITIEVMH